MFKDNLNFKPISKRKLKRYMHLYLNDEAIKGITYDKVYFTCDCDGDYQVILKKNNKFLFYIWDDRDDIESFASV